MQRTRYLVANVLVKEPFPSILPKILLESN